MRSVALPGVLKSLQGDHGQMKAMMQRISAAEDPGKRTPLYHQFRAHLLAHSEAEEASFYTALLRTHGTRILASESAREHQVALDKLRELDALEPDSSNWSTTFAQLEDDVLRHFDQEEGRAFPMAIEKLDTLELERLDSQFWMLKRAALANHD